MSIKKSISVFTALCFIFSAITSNVSALELNGNLADNFNENLPLSENSLFPAKFGKITEIKNNQSGLAVINIQDLHSNKSVQLNISGILQSIAKRYKIKEIFVEGGYGNIDVSWVNKIEDANLRNGIVEQLLSEGRFTGAEYFSYKTKQTNILKGLEDEQIHKDNLKKLSQILDKQNFYSAYLKKIKSDIDFIAAKYSSDKNLRLNKLIDKYNSGKTDSVKFYKLLLKSAADINENPQNYNNLLSFDLTDFDNISKYVNINYSGLNDKKLSKEINSFLIVLKSKIPYETYSAIVKDTANFSDINKLSYYISTLDKTYNTQLKEKYPVLNVFVNNIMTANSVNPVNLISEERILLNILRQSYSKSDTEYEVSFLTDFYYIFSNYLTNKLTAEDYDYFASKIDKFKNIYSKYAAVDRLKDLHEDIDKLNGYYAVNNKRNSIFINHIFSERQIPSGNYSYSNGQMLDKAGQIIVVISGGYHTRGIGKLLSEKAVSYITITPNISGGIGESEQYYQDIVKQQARTDSNALCFTIASSTNDILQFNDAVNAAIKLSGGIYSKEVLEDIVKQMKPLVAEQVSAEYGDDRTVISAGGRKIILHNKDGKIKSDENEDILPQPSTRINYSFINSLFENNPSLNFANGLIFELRNADKYVDKIGSVDLSVVARLPEIFQQYLYATLEDGLKRQLLVDDNVYYQAIIKENDKLPDLFNELAEMFYEQILRTSDFEKLKEELLLSHTKIIDDQSKYGGEFTVLLQEKLYKLLETNLSKVQISYVLALLIYLQNAAGSDNAVASEGAKFDKTALGVFTQKIVELNTSKNLHLLTQDNRLTQIILKIKNAKIRGYLLNFYRVVIAPLAEAAVINRIFYAELENKNKADILIAKFLNSHIEFKRGTPQQQDALASGLEYVLNEMLDYGNKVYDRTHIKLISDFALKITNIVSHSRWNRTQISALPGKILEPEKISKIKVIMYTAVAVMIMFVLGRSFNQTQIRVMPQETVQPVQQTTVQPDARIMEFANVINDYLNKPVTAATITLKAKLSIDSLQKYLQSAIKTESNESFYSSLFELRENITSVGSQYIPEFDNYNYVDVYRNILDRLDQFIIDNFDRISADEILKEKLTAAYSDDEIEFLKVLSVKGNHNKLLEIVNSGQNIKYRFYAYMLLMSDASYVYNKTDFANLLNKEQIIKYIRDNYFIYSDDGSVNFVEIKNRYEWRTFCGISEFLIAGADDINMIQKDFQYIFNNAELVKMGTATSEISNVGLFYVLQDDSNAIVAASHEISHLRFLNILGWSYETLESKFAELYAYLGNEIILSYFDTYIEYPGVKKISDINNDTWHYDIAFIVLQEVKEACGIDTFYFLQEAIIEYSQDKTVTKPDVKTQLKSILTIFANKVADNQITQGAIKEETRQEKVTEIINNFYFQTAEPVQSEPGSDGEQPIKEPDIIQETKTLPLSASFNGFLNFLFLGGIFNINKKKIKKQQINNQHLDYVAQQLQQNNAMTFKNFKKIKFTNVKNGVNASYRHGKFFQKPETVFIDNTALPEEVYVQIKGLLTDYIQTDLDGNVHYYTKFFKRDIRRKILAPLFAYSKDDGASTKYGYVLEILKTKIKNNDRTFRFWSCGSATGEELRTFAAFTRQAITDLGEDIALWKLDFYGTDNNKTTARIAAAFGGHDTIDGTDTKVKVNTEGFNIKYVILNHVQEIDLNNWLIWQKSLGGFDLICQLNNPTPESQQKAVVTQVLNNHGIYVHHDRLYDSSNKEIEVVPFDIAFPQQYVTDTAVKKTEPEKISVLKKFYGLLFSKRVFSASAEISGQAPKKVGVKYVAISVPEISRVSLLPKYSDGEMIYENIFVIDRLLDSSTIRSLGFKPLGLKIGHDPIFISTKTDNIYIYAENTDYKSIVKIIKLDAIVRDKITKHVKKIYNIDIDTESRFVLAQIVKKSKNPVDNDNGLLTIRGDVYSPEDNANQQQIMLAYSDVITRYGFAVRESIFRYIDDFDINTSKKKRIKEFVNILKEQKNVSCRLILDYDVYKQLSEDLQTEEFGSLLKQAKSKNISVYVFVSGQEQKNNVGANILISGVIEASGDDMCRISDSLTGDEFEAKFVLNCNSVEEIISAINNNIAKQPLIFKNSQLKQAFYKEQDGTLSGKLRDIFAFGRISDLISIVKSQHLSQKISDTYNIASLAENFSLQDQESLVKLYKKFADTEFKSEEFYKQIADILKKDAKIKLFFEFNSEISENNVQQIQNNGLFIEQIIFRIAAAGELLKAGKEIGLKNRKYEEILARALQYKTTEADKGLQIDRAVLNISEDINYDELVKEQMLKRYLDENISELTRRAFSKTQPDSVAINTLIFLIPFAEVSDIEIDITALSLEQHDLRITRQVLASA